MSWLKYKLTIILFIVVVAAGVSVALSEFNAMVYPVGPVGVFSLKGGEYGIYQMEFLGEKIRVEFPSAFIEGLFSGETVKDSKEHLTGAIKNLKNSSGQALHKWLLFIRSEGERIVSAIASRASEIIGTSPLRTWLPVGGAKER